MRRGVCVGLAAAAVAGLAACSSSTPLAAVTTDQPASTTSSATTAATSAATASSGSTAPTVPTTLTVTHGDLPPGLSAEAQAVANGWLGYWDFVGKVLANPADPQAIAGVGAVATGKAATDLVAQIQGQAKDGQHVVGTTAVTVTQASASGSSGTVCSTLKDISNSVDANGAVVNPPLLRTPTFSAKLQLDGPAWRVNTITRVDSC